VTVVLPILVTVEPAKTANVDAAPKATDGWLAVATEELELDDETLVEEEEDELDVLLETREELERVLTLERETFDDLMDDLELERELAFATRAARMQARKPWRISVRCALVRSPDPKPWSLRCAKHAFTEARRPTGDAAAETIVGPATENIDTATRLAATKK
jgi:hypothetical protein